MAAFGDHLEPSLCDQCGHAAEDTIRCSVRESKNLCQGCFQDLPQSRGEDIGNPEWVCNIHLNRKVNDFCKTCQLGCCKECALDVHQSHEVVNVFKLGEEIRRDLTEQLQEVGVRAERLSELRRDIESSLGKIEEAPKLVDKVVEEIKEEVAQNLEKEINRIQWEAQLNIINHERKGDNMLKLVKEKADLDIQRIQEIQHGISTGLLKDAEKRRCKIQKAESKLLVGQQACESADLQIKYVLESTPEKLVCEGRRLCSFAKASLAFQCQNDISESCKEVEADLPNLKVEKGNFFNGIRPFSPLLKTVLCIFVVFYYANLARGGYRDEYNDMLSSESITSMIMVCSCFFPMNHAHKCLVLTLLLTVSSTCDYPISRRESFIQRVKLCFKLVYMGLEFWLLTAFYLILMSSPLYLFEVKSVSANIVSIISILQSCSFLYGMRHSKTLKGYCDYLKLYTI